LIGVKGKDFLFSVDMYMNVGKMYGMYKDCKSDDCEAYHCPKCGGHTLGWLDTYQRCNSCELEAEQQENVKFFCKIFDHHVEAYRGQRLVAMAVAGMVGDPDLQVLANVNGIGTLTFSEINIIMDNWNQMKEMEKI